MYCISQAATGISCLVLCLRLFKLCWQIEEGKRIGLKNNFERMPYSEKLRTPSVLLFSKKERRFVYSAEGP